MRDIRPGTVDKRKKPQSLPPLQPRGFAVDVTPRTKKVSLAARGSEMISRNTFERYLRDHSKAQLGPGEKKAVNLLKTNRPALLKPENSHYLSALQRTQPGDRLHTAIYTDPQAARQHQILKQGISRTLNRVVPSTPPPRPSPVADVYAAHDPLQRSMQQQARQQQALTVGPSAADKRAAAFAAMPGASDWVSKALGGFQQSILGMPAFATYLGTTDPRKSIPRVGATIGKSFLQTAEDPFRGFPQLRKDPASFIGNVGAVLGAGVGTVGRVGEASRTLGVARETEAAAARGTPGFGGTTMIQGPTGKFMKAPTVEQAVTGDKGWSGIARFAPGGQKVKAATYGFTHPQTRNFIDAYTSRSPAAQARAQAEEAQIMQQLKDTAEGTYAAPVKGVKAKGRQKYAQIRQDIRETRAADRAAREKLMGENVGFVGPALAHVIRGGVEGYRELADGVRAGTIYLRPAYLPNNWAGNTFMNMVHQGAYAPINLAKSNMVRKALTPEELRQFRTATGQTSLQQIAGGRGRGYVRAVTDPVAEWMGKVADQPFRDSALLHELRRRGYTSVQQVKDLASRSHAGDPAAMKELASAGRTAQEEIVKFGKMNDAEKQVIRNVFFVWNWVKGAGRYGARFPLAHPVQAGVYGSGGRTIGQQEVTKRIGGLPPYLRGIVPIAGGRAFNPYGVNPLGTAVNIGQALGGLGKEVFPSQFGTFNIHTDQDLTDMFAPVPKALIQAREGVGGRGIVKDLYRNIAAYRAYHGFMHPGSGSTYPGTRVEAIGNFVFGSLYPRKYDPQAIQSALERMNIDHPEALIDGMKKRFKQATGMTVPPSVESAYRHDLQELRAQKTYKSDYADSHDKSSFRKLPPANRVEAALDYVSQNHFISPEQVGQFRSIIDSTKSDPQLAMIENSLWALTNAGQAKRQWNQMMAVTKQAQLTRKIP